MERFLLLEWTMTFSPYPVSAAKYPIQEQHSKGLLGQQKEGGPENSGPYAQDPFPAKNTGYKPGCG